MPYFKFGNARIHYRLEGSGQQVLFVHGVAGSGEDMEGFARALGRGFSSVLVDLPGAGRSRGYLSLNGLISALQALMSYVGAGKYSCVGYSLGAGICSILNRLDGRVERFAALAPVVSDFRPFERWMYLLIRGFLKHGPAYHEIMRDIIYDSTADPKNLSEEFVQKRIRYPITSMLYQLYLGMQINTGFNLLHSTKPLLVVSGRHDSISPPREVQRYLSGLARFYAVDKGHADIFGEDLRIRGRNVLRDFLRGAL